MPRRRAGFGKGERLVGLPRHPRSCRRVLRESGGRHTVSDFLSWFPGITREQVEAVLEYAIRSLRNGSPDGLVMKLLFDQGTPSCDKHALAQHLVGLGSFCYTNLYIDVCGLFPSAVRQPKGLPNINISAAY